MKRSAKRMVSLIVSLALCLELLPLSVLAATDELWRFQLGGTEGEVVIAAAYDGTAYVMGAAREEGGRLAVPVERLMTASDEYGTYAWLDIRQSGGARLFSVQVNEPAQWQFEYAFSDDGGAGWLKAADGALSVTEPGEAAYCWKTGRLVDDEWVDALHNGDTYLVLRTDGETPYFTVSDALDEHNLPCRPASKSACSHENALVLHPGTAATCTEAGVADYWVCSLCESAGRESMFGDPHGLLPLYNPAPTPPAGHNDGDTDDLCDRCGEPMPYYVRVTMDSQIRAGANCLLAAELDGRLHLLALPELDMNNQNWLLDGTGEVAAEEDGSIKYQTAADAGAMFFRLEEAGGKGGEEEYGGKGKGGKEDGLAGAEALYTMLYGLSPLNFDGGRGFTSDESGYGWRVSLRAGEGSDSLLVSRFMEDMNPPGAPMFYLRAFLLNDGVVFSHLPSTDGSLDLGELEDYPVYLYVEGGQEDAAWSYDIVSGVTAVDCAAFADIPGFDADVAGGMSVEGLAEAVTDQTAKALVEDYRAATGSAERHYTLTAFTEVRAESYQPAREDTGKTLRYALAHRLSVSDGVNEPVVYELAREQLEPRGMRFTVYGFFEPEQAALRVQNGVFDGDVTYRLLGAPLQESLETRYFVTLDGSHVLLRFDAAGGDYPTAVELREHGLIEEHEHVFDYDTPYSQSATFRYDEEKEEHQCLRCGQWVFLRAHQFILAERDYAPAADGIGTERYECATDGCLQRETRPIDTSDWAWVHIVDQFGETVPPDLNAEDWPYGARSKDYNYWVMWNWGANGLSVPQGLDPDVNPRQFAWHYHPERLGAFPEGEETPLNCVVYFSNEAQMLYSVPSEMRFYNLKLGEAVEITVHRRTGKTVTVTGALPGDMLGWSVQGSISSTYPETVYYQDIAFNEDGTFSATVPLASTGIRVFGSTDVPENDFRSLSLTGVELMGVGDGTGNRTVELGTLDFRDHNICTRFEIPVPEDGGADAARSAYRGGRYTLRNETTGETWTSLNCTTYNAYGFPNGMSPYDTSGPFAFTIELTGDYEGHFAAGDELTLTLGAFDDAVAMEPYTFTLDEIGYGGKTQTLNHVCYYQRGSVRVDSSENELADSMMHDWWSIVFDSEGNRLSDRAQRMFLDEGDYIYVAYAKNRYVDLIDQPDAMELLGIPSSGYYKQTFTIERGKTATIQPVFEKIDPYRDVVVSATVGASTFNGEAVPIYIHFKGFDADYIDFLDNYKVTMEVMGVVNSQDTILDTLVCTDGRYATWDNDLPLEEETFSYLSDQTPYLIGHYAYHSNYSGVRITAPFTEGTICLYAKPKGQTVYIRSVFETSSLRGMGGSYTLTIPSFSVTVQHPPQYTSSRMERLVFFANLPKSQRPYVGAVSVDGRLGEPRKLNTLGRGANTISFDLGAYPNGGTSYHEVYLEVFTADGNEDDGWENLDSVYRSDLYRIALNTETKAPQPARLDISATLAGNCRYQASLDLKSSDKRETVFSFLPSYFAGDARLAVEMVYDFRLTVDNPFALINDDDPNINAPEDKRVRMTVYCGEYLAEPIIREVNLIYNENTETFDGSLIFETGTTTIDELPYGYTFQIPTPEAEPDAETAQIQAVEQLAREDEALAQSMAEAEEDALPLIDLDELEADLAQSETLEEWEKEVIRLQASFQNEYRRQIDELNATLLNLLNEQCPVEDTDQFLSEALPTTLGENVRSEHLSPEVDVAMMEDLGYLDATLENGMRCWLYIDFLTDSFSMVRWSNDPAERLHVWQGSSPLPAGTPIAAEADGLGLLSALPAMTLLGGDAQAEYEESQAKLTETLLDWSGVIVYVLGNLSTMVDEAAKCFRQIAAVENNMRAAQIMELEKALPELEGNHALAEKKLEEAFSKLYAEFRTYAQEFKSPQVLREGLRRLEQAAQQFGIEIAKVRYAADAIAHNVGEIKRMYACIEKAGAAIKRMTAASETLTKAAKFAGPALAIVGCVLDGYSFMQASEYALQECLSCKNNEGVMEDIFDHMFEDATEPCVLDREHANEVMQKCMDSYYRYCSASSAYVTCCFVRAGVKLASWAANTATSVGALMNPELLPAALISFGASSACDILATAAIAAAWTVLTWRDDEVTTWCIDPLPFEHKQSCEPKPPKNRRPRQEPPHYPAPPMPVIDPSGYVYEAVASNRLEGVTATIWYRDTDGSEAAWVEAPLYGEVYEQTTGADGRFEWMTPIGGWLVKASKDGYYDADSAGDPAAVDGWLPVPPPQLDVNIPMVSRAAPTVERVSAAADRVRVVFSQYMEESAAQAVTVTQNGAPVQPTAAVFTDREESPVKAGVFYGRTLELYGSFADGCEVSVSGAARNYAGVALAEAYASGALAADGVVASLSHVYPNRFVTDVNETERLVVAVRDTAGEPMADVPVSVTARYGISLGFDATTVVSDENGNAVFTVLGLTSGYDELTFRADTVSVGMNTRVKPLGSESPKKPTANLSGAQPVAFGTELLLDCGTEGAVIYYTTDNTCPCTESENRRQYTGAIPVFEDTLFRIAAYTPSGGYSERLNLLLTVDRSMPRVTRSDGLVTVSNLADGASALAAWYDADGRLLTASTLGDGESVARGDGALRLFFLDAQSAPVCAAWSD